MLNFSRIEVRDLALSAIVLAFALGGFSGFISSLLIVVVVFLSHEVLGHKLVAQHYGCFAEYRMWPMGLLLALITSFFGFIFAAPGAVYISTSRGRGFAFSIVHLTRRQNGLISIAGPAVNIALGAGLLAVSLLWPFGLLTVGARFSAFLAIFNLLPLGPLDGQKVMQWSRTAWVATIAAAAAIYIATIVI